MESCMDTFVRVIENLVYGAGLAVAVCVVFALFGHDLPADLASLFWS